ncbi:MAG: tyrosine-type recombinase/integrase [Gammaproteobacteria bacterium]
MPDSTQLLDQFCVWLELNAGRSPRTVLKYRRHLEALAAYLAERDLAFETAPGAELEAFTGLYMHQQGLRPRSRRPVVAAVRKFFAWLVRTGHLARNPAADVPYPKAGYPLPVFIEEKHAEKLLMAPGLDTFLGRRDTAMLSLLIGCGLRVSGLIALNESSLLFYADDKNPKRERLAVRVVEKGNRERIVPAPDECWALLRAYLGAPELDDIDRDLPNGDRVLFVSVNNRQHREDEYRGENRRLSARSVDDLVKRYGQAAGIPQAQRHAHAMRHLYGTQMAEADVDLLVRQALMGHRSPSTTEVYTRLAQRKLREAADKGNPFRRIRTPVTDLVRELQRSP